MNTACKSLVSAGVLSLLAACATADTARATPARVSTTDTDYVAAVEKAAAESPVRVDIIWVNPPEAARGD